MFLKFLKKITGQNSSAGSKHTAQKETVTYSISGMHCSSCAMSIDGALEDIAGVQSATTSYPKSTTAVTFNSKLISSEVLQNAIKNLGYTAKVTKK